MLDQSEQPECMDTGDSNAEHTIVQSSSVDTSSTDDEVLYCTNVLEQFARQHELVIHDVPRDGNCLFSSVAYQLQNVGHNVNASILRQMVVDYLSDNSEYYSQSVHQPVASNDEYDADNETHDEEDAYINAIVYPETQRI